MIVTQRSDFDAECEILWTHCKFVSTKAKSFLFGTFYRPNSSDLESLIELDKSLFSSGDKIQHQNVVAGDFYAPNSNWETLELTSNMPTSEKLLEIIDKHDLCQMVMQPTRRQLSINNVIDLALSNNPSIIRNIKTIPSISDHDIVPVTLDVHFKRRKNVK